MLFREIRLPFFHFLHPAQEESIANSEAGIPLSPRPADVPPSGYNAMSRFVQGKHGIM
jgi:hypothetical protein